jgi:hypothetical protein
MISIYNGFFNNVNKFVEQTSKFSISSACIRKIPLNPPLQKGEEDGMPGLIEKLQRL